MVSLKRAEIKVHLADPVRIISNDALDVESIGFQQLPPCTVRNGAEERRTFRTLCAPKIFFLITKKRGGIS